MSKVKPVLIYIKCMYLQYYVLLYNNVYNVHVINIKCFYLYKVHQAVFPLLLLLCLKSKKIHIQSEQPHSSWYCELKKNNTIQIMIKQAQEANSFSRKNFRLRKLRCTSGPPPPPPKPPIQSRTVNAACYWPYSISHYL